jgi:hypothetical protein
MAQRPTPEAITVAEAFRHLGIDAEVEGGSVRLTATGDLISVHFGDPGSGVQQIVVRDHVSPAEAKRLHHAGIGWLDLNGHLWFRSSTVAVDSPVPGRPDQLGPSAQRRTMVLAGAVVSGVTLAALAVWPEPLAGVRSTARALDASPAGVSYAIERLTAAGYLTSDRRATAELFWEAAAEWRPTWVEVPVLSLPPSTEAVAVGGLAAALLGAPVAVTDATAPEYLFASTAVISYAAMSASSHSGDPGLIARCAVAPAPITTKLISHPTPEINTVPVAAEALVALSLAIDPARGAETIRSWEGDHVWS